PNKIFEYMAAELPVVASHFPFWMEIVEGSRCGIGVDPEDVGAIAAAVRQILEAPKTARAMGRRGREAVEREYNWLAQEKKLVQFYERLLA
ncbi:MAG: glycosyltransferase, partial [Bacteroidota bacterium]